MALIMSKHGVLVAHKPVKTLRTTLMLHKDSLEPNEQSTALNAANARLNTSEKLANV